MVRAPRSSIAISTSSSLERSTSACSSTSRRPEGPAPLARTRDIRKSSGSFYTPRAVTTYLVRQTLEPLIRGRTADEILTLRVLDPAMGSGAFLVAACRYLASAVEEALVHEGRWHAHDVTPADRVALRREIASRCLFGVDLNPMAVQLARLSLWLATLAADKPLSFLDHHLVAGHSLVGATPEDMSRQPGGGPSRKRPGRLSLFEETELSSALAHAARVISKVSTEPDDSADIVRAKERALRALHSGDSSLGQVDSGARSVVRRLVPGEGTPERGVFQDLVDRLFERPIDVATTHRSSAPGTVRDDRRAASLSALAARHSRTCSPVTSGRPSGFDAIIGNPPWDMVRGDSGVDETRAGRRLEAQQVTQFVRQSGIYQVESRAHVNLYQLFVERALQLVRPGGRIGFVVPSGLVERRRRCAAATAPLRSRGRRRGHGIRQSPRDLSRPSQRQVRAVHLHGRTGDVRSALPIRVDERRTNSRGTARATARPDATPAREALGR